MRERNGRYILMDFGAGVMQRSDGSSGREATVGTPLYMAPELFYGAPASRKTDIYAAGVLLYFLVTGEYPVSGDTIETLKAAHRTSGGRTRLDERRTELPGTYVGAVDAATSPDPAERPESIAVLLRALTPLEPLAPTSWSFPTWTRVIGATAAAVIAVGVVSGLLTSWTFNTIVDRPPEFDGSSYAEVIAMGFRSLLFPTLVSGALLLPWPRERVRRQLSRTVAHLPRSEYAAALAQLSVVIGIASVVLLFWVFGDVVLAFVRTISYFALDGFAVFRNEAGARGQRVGYRLSVAVLLAIVALVWRSVRSVRRANGGTVPVWVRAAGVALVALLAMLSQAPYKAMFHNQVPVIVLDGTRCYLLGERAGSMRVFCPSGAVPRVRTIDSSRATIERCGATENIFDASSGTSCPSRAQE
jgi:hypothetical protein